MSVTYRSALRQVLGVKLYRFLTQTPRYLRFLANPKRDRDMPLLPLLIKPDDYCFDIGANYGQYTREISPLLTTGRLFAFEPSAMNRFGLTATVKLFGLTNASVFACALSDAEGEAVLHVPVKAHGGLGIALSYLGTPSHEQTVDEAVTVTTLDAFIASHDIPRCDFIKCDVEGSELNMLKGAVATIARFRPLLQLEVCTQYLARNGHGAADIGGFLRDLNYRAFVSQDGRLQPVDGDVVDVRNNFFIPEEKLAQFALILNSLPHEKAA